MRFLHISPKLILITSGLLLLAAAFLFPKLEDSQDFAGGAAAGTTLQFEISGKQEKYRINAWQSEEGQDVLFLPSFADRQNIRIRVRSDIGTNVQIDWNGFLLKNGETCPEVLPDTEIPVAVLDSDGSILEQKTCLILQSDHLPAIFLETRSGDIGSVDSSKENRETGYLYAASAEGKLTWSGKVDKINSRGNTSWDVPKKSYSIRLQNAAGLYGMEPARKWILSANYYDGSYLRNEVGQYLAGQIGLDRVDSAYAELYIDGTYRGLYQLTERIEVWEGRIENDDDYLVEYDYPERAITEKNVIYLDNGQPLVIHNPGKVSQEQKESLQSWYREVSDAAYAKDFRNPETGKHITEYLDLESFASKYLMEEFLMDLDMGVTSQYMYHQDGLLYDGPLWDLDNTMGRGGYEDWTVLFAVQNDWDINPMTRLYARLAATEPFYDLVVQKWEKELLPELQQLDSRIDEQAELLRPSVRMDQIRWPGARSSFMPETDFGWHMDYLKDYVHQRTDVMQRLYGDEREATRQLLREHAEELPELLPITMPEE